MIFVRIMYFRKDVPRKLFTRLRSCKCSRIVSAVRSITVRTANNSTSTFIASYWDNRFVATNIRDENIFEIVRIRKRDFSSTCLFKNSVFSRVDFLNQAFLKYAILILFSPVYDARTSLYFIKILHCYCKPFLKTFVG